MNPNDDQSTVASDYLDQIAPKKSKSADFLKQRPIIIGALVLFIILLVIVVGIIAIGTSKNIKPLESLATKLVSTKAITSKAGVNIKNTKLLGSNSNLDIYLTNTIRDITPQLTKEKIDIKKINQKVIIAENTKILERLEAARLNVKYDIVYSGEMAAQLDDILILMNQTYKTTKNKDLKNFLNTAIDNLKPTQKQFANFNTSNI